MNKNEIKEFCKKYDIDEASVDWSSSMTATEDIMGIFFNDEIELNDIDVFYDIIGYSFIVPDIVQECREAYCDGRRDRYEEGYHYGLYSEDICCYDEGYESERGGWYDLGYADMSAYDEGIMDS